ncbi:hypothetical protein OHA_1_01062 [Pleomorphomonas sp. SM30]|uniref:Uncharacterized protein n=1 Tax=Oharaeibacter diazotrophicus TaxID=1920512 RepID=A0A4R6RIZ5_9HYPH|nr:hypothetical protein EDD54_0450 [Oharaeibacter diazotrophicus]BBE71487.1 hypothetical protein OHA_1_01062 [Pleomorphomonas sp. SM30]GLS78248.1 hypothetical protein GCM10007904_35850 [Oharaeibacter diazotrophicus]
MDDRIETLEFARLERAEYIERMTQELSRLAAGANLPMLAYLLEMAAEEAAALRESAKVRLAPEEVLGRAPRGGAP